MGEQKQEERVLELEKKVAILTQLANISASLNSRVELHSLLQYIMQVAVNVVDCEAASVLLWDEHRQQLIFEASTTASKKNSSLIGMAVPMDSIAGEIYLENKAVRVDNADAHPKHYDKVDEDIQFQTRDLLGVPMTSKDRVIGVLQAINKNDGSWTNDDQNYLSLIAAQAAVAIEGAQLVARLRKAYDELNELDALKNDFIAIASHELRTPLGVIMGYASFLQEEESQTAKDNASKVLESALKLRKIIEDMVNLRYLKQNEGDLHMETMSVNDLLKSLKQEVNTLMDLSDHHFETRYLPQDVQVTIDPTRMSMALSNILQNAISFTQKGDTITLQAEISQGEVYLSVADTGLGIENDDLERIFEEFTQVEDHMTRKHGGLGIGLSISRAIVYAHGGRIWAESEGIGKGSTFYVVIPEKSVVKA